MLDVTRVRRGSRSATVAGVAGLAALALIGLFFSVGQPFGTLNDLALLVMTVALGPVMLAFYELGGRTPLVPARLALGSSLAAIGIWSIVQAAMIAGVVTFDYDHGATGAFAVEAVTVILIGAWLVGAPLLAGPWLPAPLRWLGAACGLGFIVFGIGLLLGGAFHPLTIVGGLGYQIAFPIWALLIGRLLARRAAAA
jgi:hypothetical protein